MMYIDYILSDSKCNRYATRYIQFIEHCRSRKLQENMLLENHHILPKAVYSEFADLNKNPRNSIMLTQREHFLAHWMLAKAYQNKKCWFAFNMMRRVGHTSVLYSLGKSYIRKAISASNLGRKRTPEFSKNVSKRMLGTAVYRCSKTGKHLRLSCNDDRVLNGEYVSYRNGYTHTQETKNKIGRKDYVLCIDTTTGKKDVNLQKKMQNLKL